MSLATSRPAVPARLTEDEFERWCTEEVRAELVNGRVVVISPVPAEHDQLQLFLTSLLGGYLELRPQGRLAGPRFEARLRPGLRCLPDLHFVSKEHLDRVKGTYLEGAPDAAFEIVSPDSVGRDWRDKYSDYEAAGVREYWPKFRSWWWQITATTFFRA
ncbi:MAG: Uma2 family endonuclease [Armatimonadota bacterium]